MKLILTFAFWLFVVVVGGIGWVMNIINIIGSVKASTEITAMLVLQCIGIFVAPLGAVLGYVL